MATKHRSVLKKDTSNSIFVLKSKKQKMKHKILLVEDQPIILKTLEYRLKKEGYEVTSCSNGKDAQDAFETNQYQTVLTDLIMPQACGFELLHFIRQVKDSSTPVVIFSDVNIEEKSDEAIENGANHFIRKPFDLDEVMGTVKFFSNL